MTANIVNISGGKDSTATLLLAIERDTPNLSAVFADTGHEHPLTYEYIEYLRAKLGVPIRTVRARFAAQIAGKREYIMRRWANDGVPQSRIDRALEVLVPSGNPFLDLCLWKGRFPSPKARFCTQELKVLPLNLQVLFPAVSRFGHVLSWQGVRRDESRARRGLIEMEKGEAAGLFAYRPILDWTADDCFDMHRRHGIEWNPLYQQGMGRVGCMPCIMARKAEVGEIANRFPTEIERLSNWERLVSDASKRGSSTFYDARTLIGKHSKEDVHYTTHGIGQIVEWAKTTRGGNQFDLLSSGEPPMCASNYGLCE